ncbi:hypothetical protein D3C87_161840 [compost metagenome]
MRITTLLITLLFAPLASFATGTLNISAEPQAQPDQFYNYNFGNIFKNQRTYADFTLTAGGDAPTEIQGIRISGFEFTAQSNCPKILMPTEFCTTRVYFWPNRAGQFWGELSFHLKENNIYIRLFGAAH